MTDKPLVSYFFSTVQLVAPDRRYDFDVLLPLPFQGEVAVKMIVTSRQYPDYLRVTSETQALNHLVGLEKNSNSSASFWSAGVLNLAYRYCLEPLEFWLVKNSKGKELSFHFTQEGPRRYHLNFIFEIYPPS